VSRAGRVAAVVAGTALALLVAAQLLLPGIAERRLRHRLERTATVDSVSVRAFPAVKLLWHRADDVTVRLDEIGAPQGRFADLLAQTRDAGTVDASAREQRILTLRLRDSRLRKRGDELRLASTVTDGDLRAALPPGLSVRPVASGQGALVFEGGAELLGRRFAGQVVVAAREGRLLLAPRVPFGGLLAVTLFADPRIEVLGVAARRRPGGFTFTARARLRG
jgi:hypothetical protein